MSKKLIRIGFIGSGSIARCARIPRMQKDGAARLVAVADPDPEQVRKTVETWGGKVASYDDYRDMIRCEKLDAVFISTPHSQHFDQAATALRGGLHVLVEKPLTILPRHARELISLAKKQKRILAVGYQRHFKAPFLYGREVIRAGLIGRVCGVSCYITQYWGGGGWRGVRELAGGGFMMDTGSHLVAATLWLTGLQPKKVFASLNHDGISIDRNAVLQVEFDGGALGSFSFFGSAARHDECISIHGTKGCLVYRNHEWKLTGSLINDEPMRIPKRIGNEFPDDAFFRAIRNRGRGIELPLCCVDVARLTEAAYRSVDEGRMVKVR